MNAHVDLMQASFEEAYSDAANRIKEKNHGLSDKSLAWVLDKEYARNAFYSPVLKLFGKTLFDYLLLTMRREQQACRKAVVYDVAAPANPYYPNANTNRVGD
jgi:uncharacterized membrane protein YgaE (UPF0421/DUF939 family)